MPLDFPDNPSDGDIFQGYVYNATRGVWDIKLLADQNLEYLNNVNVTDPADGQALIYDLDNDEWIAGDVASGPAPAKIIDSNSINVDFSDGIELEKRTVTGDVTFTGSNYTSGVKKTIYLEGDEVQRSLTFPNEWTFLTDTPTAIGASKNNILDLNSFGTSASNTVAIWLGRNAFEPITATGGTVTEIISSGVTWRVHSFTSSGTFVVTDPGLDPYSEYLIVAGGGGGGLDVGGGGGAGGLLEASYSDIIAGNYNILVGSGGVVNSGNGGNSSAFDFTAFGGGGGGNYNGGIGKNGGSGGGGAGYNSPANPGFGTPGQGYDGGPKSSTGSTSITGSGGGGAGGPGAQGASASFVEGGAGKISFISGTAITYAKGGRGASDNWTGMVETAPNTGNGGDGAGTPNDGKSGGSGIVIIRYPITDPN